MAFKFDMHGVTFESAVDDRSEMTIATGDGPVVKIGPEQAADLAAFLQIVGCGDPKIIDAGIDRVMAQVKDAMRAAAAVERK